MGKSKFIFSDGTDSSAIHFAVHYNLYENYINSIIFIRSDAYRFAYLGYLS